MKTIVNATVMKDSKEKIVFLPKQSDSKLKLPVEKVEISKEEIINTLKTIESLKRKWLSYIKK